MCRGLERLQPTKRRWHCANLCCVFCEGRRTVRSLTDRRWPSAPGDKRGEISSVTIWLVAFQLSICLRDSHSGGLMGVGRTWGLHTRTHTGYSDRHTHTQTHRESLDAEQEVWLELAVCRGSEVCVMRAESRTRFSLSCPGNLIDAN